MITVLNERLLEQQKVTPEQEARLYEIYKDMQNLFDEANNDVNLDKNGGHYAEILEELEFALQDNWNFPRDATRHKYWFTFKKCTCPKMDNRELWGVDRRIISADCPFHGV